MNNKLRRFIAPVFAAAAIAAAYAEPASAQDSAPEWCASWLPTVEWAVALREAQTPFINVQHTILNDPDLSGREMEIAALIAASAYVNSDRDLQTLQSAWLNDCHYAVGAQP